MVRYRKLAGLPSSFWVCSSTWSYVDILYCCKSQTRGGVPPKIVLSSCLSVGIEMIWVLHIELSWRSPKSPFKLTVHFVFVWQAAECEQSQGGGVAEWSGISPHYEMSKWVWSERWRVNKDMSSQSLDSLLIIVSSWQAEFMFIGNFDCIL